MNQQELPAIPAPARPTANEEIIMLAAQALGHKLGIDPISLVRCYEHPMDGYTLARALENEDGLSIDRATMEDLDEMEDMVDSRVIKAQKVWAEENNIQPTLPTGARVKCNSRNDFGFITDILNDGHHVACYAVKPEAAGQPESLRWIVKFEGVTAAFSVVPS